MHQTLSERKREILMRSAESRLAALESLNSAVVGVGHTWSYLQMPRPYLRIAMMAGGGMVGAWLMRKLFWRKKPAPAIAASQGTGHSVSSSVLYLLVQVISILLLPQVKSRVENSGWGSFIKRMHPTHLFFRWLGLEK